MRKLALSIIALLFLVASRQGRSEPQTVRACELLNFASQCGTLEAGTFFTSLASEQAASAAHNQNHLGRPRIEISASEITNGCRASCLWMNNRLQRVCKARANHLVLSNSGSFGSRGYNDLHVRRLEDYLEAHDQLVKVLSSRHGGNPEAFPKALAACAYKGSQFTPLVRAADMLMWFGYRQVGPAMGTILPQSIAHQVSLLRTLRTRCDKNVMDEVLSSLSSLGEANSLFLSVAAGAVSFGRDLLNGQVTPSPDHLPGPMLIRMTRAQVFEAASQQLGRGTNVNFIRTCTDLVCAMSARLPRNDPNVQQFEREQGCALLRGASNP
ncbi:MAG: hypothetical protein EXR74_07880 [Bdellovibrionales bacterium]|nr:hypothetical protein [Bdellovibrionales bacterium]